MPRPQRSRLVPLVVALLVALPATMAPAQPPQFEWPVHPRNLKVLPRSTTPDQLRETMVGFTQSLGGRDERHPEKAFAAGTERRAG